ncbi:hypothetical protein TSOC_006912 [Tetrabaena socialis]|uniref:Uncharacterized protein n=1 Tax=Tetrabaena socialis TaxID=47790 RepID=A0A2J8A2F2_9CHLO|nr:hypothetical protein TSOC_006912 [Tetrabaena socialis]|eukprot:PNH06699.1 hypothetical protein TSOC_006912 [Tetrabaena socialis]
MDAPADDQQQPSAKVLSAEITSPKEQLAALQQALAAGPGERLTSREQFLRDFCIKQELRLAPNVSKQSGGNYPDRDIVSPWDGFAPMAQRQLGGLSPCPLDLYHQASKRET